MPETATPAGGKAVVTQGTFQALTAGLSVANEPNLSPLDRFGPLLALVVYIAAIFLLAFEVVPNPAGMVSLIGVFGPFVGAWAAKLGARQ